MPPLTLTAPAKINLYLHITGKREDGYHLLDSLTAPIDGIADRITIAPSAAGLSLNIIGPCAALLSGDDPRSNLVWRAAEKIAAYVGHKCDIAITLEKNIPPGAGLGGGSADAAACVCALLTFWNAMIDDDDLHALLLSLGSDVPTCYAGRAVHMRGTGDIIDPTPALPALPVVLIWPGAPSSTPAAYKAYRAPFRAGAALPPAFTQDSFVAFLKDQTNDLYEPALLSVPAMRDAIAALEQQNGLLLARMSGSGSACFGLFGNERSAACAADMISRSSPPTWWVQRGALSSRH